VSYTEIRKCRGCGSIDLRSVLDLGIQYIVNFVDSDEEADKAPIHLVVCANCRLVQLKHTVNPDRLFRQFWYFSGVNTTMREHLRDLVTQACTINCLQPGDTVIDIGANDGELLANFPRNINTIGIEPARNMLPQLRKNCTLAINDYFSDIAVSTLKERKTKAKQIYSIAMFYDINEPEEFLDNIKKVLAKDGVFIIQMNYLKTMMENVAVDNILHEHLCFYSLQSLEPILTRSKLKVFHVSINDINGGSIRLYICHENDDRMTYFSYIQQVTEENNWFGPAYNSKLNDKLKFFANRVITAREKLQKFMKDCKENHKNVYAYGASTRGNSLLQVMGLKYPAITYAVEKNPLKFGKHMAGTNIEIISENDMHNAPPDYLLILPYFFFEEFKYREESFLKNGGKFIVPLPQPFLYDGESKVTLL